MLAIQPVASKRVFPFSPQVSRGVKELRRIETTTQGVGFTECKNGSYYVIGGYWGLCIETTVLHSLPTRGKLKAVQSMSLESKYCVRAERLRD